MTALHPCKGRKVIVHNLRRPQPRRGTGKDETTFLVRQVKRSTLTTRRSPKPFQCSQQIQSRFRSWLAVLPPWVGTLSSTTYLLCRIRIILIRMTCRLRRRWLNITRRRSLVRPRLRISSLRLRIRHELAVALRLRKTVGQHELWWVPYPNKRWLLYSISFHLQGRDC